MGRRRQPPRMIDASHFQTSQADHHRELARPAPVSPPLTQEQATREVSAAAKAVEARTRPQVPRVRVDEPFARRQAARTVAEGLKKTTIKSDAEIMKQVAWTLGLTRGPFEEGKR